MKEKVNNKDQRQSQDQGEDSAHQLGDAGPQPTQINLTEGTQIKTSSMVSTKIPLN